MRCTYYDVLEDKANRKHVEQLRNECVMLQHFRHWLLQRMFAMEIISLLFDSQNILKSTCLQT